MKFENVHGIKKSLIYYIIQKRNPQRKGPETYKAASEEQKAAWKDFDNEETKKQTPILGNVKDWSSSGPATSQVAQGAAVDPDSDDLPFQDIA